MASADPDTLFDAAFLSQLETLALLARQLVRGKMKAHQRSHQRGASVEFAEYRSFVEGDDWRNIDWNAYARFRQLVLKLFVEEEDLHVHLLLDATGSMDWGTPPLTNKFDHARRLLAGLAYLSLSNLDRVAVHVIGSPDAVNLPPSRGKNRFLTMLRHLAKVPVSHQEVSLEQGMHRWTASSPRRGMAIFVSDLFGSSWEDARNALDRLRYTRHDMAVLQITSPDEGEGGDLGEFRIEDCETGAGTLVAVSPSVRKAYAERFAAYQDELARYCRQWRIPLIQASTTTPAYDLLQRCLMEGGFVR